MGAWVLGVYITRRRRWGEGGLKFAASSVFVFIGGNGKRQPIVYRSHQVSPTLKGLPPCVHVRVHVCVSGRVKDTKGREWGGVAALYRPGGHVNNPKIVSRLF